MLAFEESAPMADPLAPPPCLAIAPPRCISGWWMASTSSTAHYQVIDLGFGPGFSLDKPELGREWIKVDGTEGADHPSGARMMRSWTVFLQFFWPSSRRFYKLVDFSIHLTTFSEDWPPLHAVCFRMTDKAFQQTKSEDIFRPQKSESGFKRFTNFRV